MKAILLVRVSTQHQDLVQQTEQVKAEALKDGYNEKDIIIIEDKESAVKLSEEERNGLNNLKTYIEHGDIDCVYTYEVSRISRRPDVLYSIRNYLFEHQVQLIILKPYIKMLNDDGTMSETSNLFLGIFASMAENEGYIRKARMRRGVEKKRSLGYYVGGKKPFGYQIINKRFVVDESQADIVKRIFNDYVYGNKSLRAIAAELTEEGIFKNRLNAHQTIANIISKQYYCGDKAHKQIISEELYNAAQEKRNNKIYYKKHNDSLCKGLLIDKNSGYRLASNIAGKQYYVRNYNCAKNIQNVSISFKAIDTLITGITLEWYNTISGVKHKEIIMSINNEIERQKRIISTMENNITANQDKIDRIEERYIDGKINKDKADQLEHKVFDNLNSFKQKITNANNKIIELNEQLNNTKPNIMTLRDKVLYVIDRIYVSRLSRFICEIIVINKFTGEHRIYQYNTRTCEILNSEIILRPSLNYIQ